MEAINKESGDYLGPDGVIYQIVAYFDEDGLECEWFEARYALAGGGQRWFSIDLGEFFRRPE